MLINYYELFRPYMQDGHTLEATFRYLKKFAAQRGISDAIMELGINEVFMEAAGGKQFSKTKCHCGCGIDKAATDFIHTIQERIVEISENQQVEINKLLQDRCNTAIISHISRMNAEYTEKELKPNRLVDWSKSPVIKAGKKINGLLRSNKQRDIPGAIVPAN